MILVVVSIPFALSAKALIGEAEAKAASNKNALTCRLPWLIRLPIITLQLASHPLAVKKQALFAALPGAVRSRRTKRSKQVVALSNLVDRTL